MYTVHPAMAVYPGLSPFNAMRALGQVEQDGAFRLDLSQAQITPQNPCRWNEAQLDALCEAYPETRFRFHASVRLGAFDHKPYWYDLSRYIKDPEGGRRYFSALAKLNRRLGSPTYTFHSGFRPRLRQWQQALIQAYREIESIMECEIAVETLYPMSAIRRHANPRIQPQRWWLDTWDEHEWLLETDINYVVDLSHLNIITQKEGRNDALVRALLVNPRMKELHLSSNEGDRDAHQALSADPSVWWLGLLGDVHPDADWFSEGRLDGGADR